MSLIGKVDPKLGQAPEGMVWYKCDCRGRDCHRRFVVSDKITKESDTVLYSTDCDPRMIITERMVVSEDDRGQKTYGPLIVYQNPVPTV
ncbi:MAG: hypothetical protein UV74_C0013G0053 [Candidatus Woesebacteria bacterium GW2011_GWB1_43_14]|uniref:Uncharacterized protein n=1 Tax=Candidatus Woesebacteria bacterium GW2011_GWB1_43_14 TaxID=1618578 RepID=A0A0G1FPH8_9BACT|nr:MAG: hypothetical protein UV51_C0005G0170 [Candidatus Woesebacteria bacterium GW2011_GWC1_42_9]KKS96931.1 MAG: hypothetical protein UV74_C0013G0053 [Candidatus Woesebacteria bacterium GW2011_GWB1_43_14]